jgi:hypothetical protein
LHVDIPTVASLWEDGYCRNWYLHTSPCRSSSMISVQKPLFISDQRLCTSSWGSLALRLPISAIENNHHPITTPSKNLEVLVLAIYNPKHSMQDSQIPAVASLFFKYRAVVHGGSIDTPPPHSSNHSPPLLTPAACTTTKPLPQAKHVVGRTTGGKNGLPVGIGLAQTQKGAKDPPPSFTTI